jgi:hypothetical protein
MAGNALLGKHLKHGIALEATSIGTESAPTTGLVNFNKAVIVPGQEWDNGMTPKGKTVTHVEAIASTAMDL